MTTIVNKYKETSDVYIGRGSKWGNPFVIGEDGDREEVIQLYKYHIWREMTAPVTCHKFKEDLLSLRGKRLGCFCKPQACHGYVLVDAINWMECRGE